MKKKTYTQKEVNKLIEEAVSKRIGDFKGELVRTTASLMTQKYSIPLKEAEEKALHYKRTLNAIRNLLKVAKIPELDPKMGEE